MGSPDPGPVVVDPTLSVLNTGSVLDIEADLDGDEIVFAHLEPQLVLKLGSRSCIFTGPDAAERVPSEESEAYFRTRPLGSRLAAWASPQSRPLGSRSELEHLYAEVLARHPGDEVPRPPHWGGFRLVPDAYELWQHAENRLHDRIRYERDGNSWRRERLAP